MSFLSISVIRLSAITSTTGLLVILPQPSYGGFFEFLEELGNETIAQECRQETAYDKGIKERLEQQPMDISWYQTFCPSGERGQAIKSYTQGYLTGSLVSGGYKKEKTDYQCFLTEYDRLFKAKASSKGEAMNQVLTRCNEARIVNNLNKPDVNYRCEAALVVCEKS